MLFHQPQDQVRRAAISAAGPGLANAAIFSFAINLLMLAGPLYMMLVYDRVLPSGSVPTLIGLSILIAGLYLVLCLLTIVRARLLVRTGNGLSRCLEKPVFQAQMRKTLVEGGTGGANATRDVAALREFFGSPTPAALFDAPWSPVFVFVVYLLHPVLGLIAAAGFTLLIVLGVANDLLTRRRLTAAGSRQTRGNALLSDALRNAETVGAMRMHDGLLRRWLSLQYAAQRRQSGAADTSATLAAISRTLRLTLQSAILGAGAYFALRQEISPGAIIAASIIMGRGLAPAEQAIGAWRGCATLRGAWQRLDHLLARHGSAKPRTALPPPRGALRVDKLFAGAPGDGLPHLQAVDFELAAGEALAVIGPSGAGKSTLARSLVGIWPATRGEVRLDDAKLEHWPERQLAGAIGYLPQDVELFDGTVRDNIARFAETIDDRAVVEAAHGAGAHSMILRLKDGYDTVLGEGGRQLSGGQRQRIGLARALYGDPSLIVLDEPNASLDQRGEAALLQALSGLKQRGATTVTIAHRPSVLSVADKVLVLESGRVAAFGPTGEVLNNKASGVRIGAQKVVPMPLAAGRMTT